MMRLRKDMLRPERQLTDISVWFLRMPEQRSGRFSLADSAGGPWGALCRRIVGVAGCPAGPHRLFRRRAWLDARLLAMPKISRRRVMMQAAGIGAAVVQPLAWGAQADAERTWRAFLAWLATIPPNDNPGSLLRDYRAHALAGGALAAEADGRVKVVRETLGQREEGWELILSKI